MSETKDKPDEQQAKTFDEKEAEEEEEDEEEDPYYKIIERSGCGKEHFTLQVQLFYLRDNH